MRMVPIVFFVAPAIALSGCTAIGAAADITGSVLSTAVGVTSTVIGGAARTVSGSGSESKSKSEEDDR